MKIFISGGSKSGKSMLAQTLVKKLQKNNKPLYYLATMIPRDEEDELRILRHRQERDGWGFATVEVTDGLSVAAKRCDGQGAFLLDSITALLANQMFRCDGSIVSDAYMKVAEDITGFLDRTRDAVVVSDYIYSDANLYDELTEKFRYGLSYIDRRVVELSDVAIEVLYGNCIIHKGGCHSALLGIGKNV